MEGGDVTILHRLCFCNKIYFEWDESFPVKGLMSSFEAFLLVKFKPSP